MAGPDPGALKRLMTAIAEDTYRTAGETGLSELSPSVLGAIMDVPRQEFVPDGDAASAFDNRPLPIGHGQTISQPFVVALMTELLDIRPGDKVLELGTGSGYQTVVLAALGASVYSLEIIPQLADAAAKRLARLGASNVHLQTAQGWDGWPSQAPFDAIIVSPIEAGRAPDCAHRRAGWPSSADAYCQNRRWRHNRRAHSVGCFRAAGGRLNFIFACAGTPNA